MWKPIDTAPKDGQAILIAHNHWGTINVTIAQWKKADASTEEGWYSYTGFLTTAKWWHEIPSVKGLDPNDGR